MEILKYLGLMLGALAGVALVVLAFLAVLTSGNALAVPFAVVVYVGGFALLRWLYRDYLKF